MKHQKADRRSQRTYLLVSSAFADLLLEKPYDEILVQDILDRSGIGHTTFYAHYFDKEDVLHSMIEQMLEVFTHQIAHATARQRVVPGLELFEHNHIQAKSPMRQRPSTFFLWARWLVEARTGRVSTSVHFECETRDSL